VKAILIHGSYGSPEENWFSWLKSELAKRTVTAFAPSFPTPEGQTLENWLKAFEPYKKHLGDRTILVGHSLGAPFILRLLENGGKAKAAFLVAGFASKLGNKEFDPINSSFVEGGFNWEKIRENCPNFFVLCSDKDPYVPKENALELARNLGVEPIVIKGAGHFNSRAGYSEFPFLLNKIELFL
jgi:predicted alpha/beta hydrolase family esterase